MKLKEFISQMFSNTKTKIVDCVSAELTNDAKKQLVDTSIVTWVEENTIKLSPVQKFVITNWLVPVIPTVTQFVYDCLKQKVEGLTING